MSDFFGIGNAFKSMARVYSISARGSGRTLSLVESLKEGDRVWFTNAKEGVRVKHMCKERGVTIEALVCEPSNPDRIFRRGTARGKVIFDHSWVEQFYLNALENAERNIDLWQKESSHADGQGEAHIETRRKAEELHRWKL